MRYSYAAPKEVPADRAMLDAVASPIVSAFIYPDIHGVIFVRVYPGDPGDESTKCARCGEERMHHDLGRCIAPGSVFGDKFERDGAQDKWAVYNPHFRQAVSIRFNTVIDARSWTIVHLCKPTVRGGAHVTRETGQGEAR